MDRQSGAIAQHALACWANVVSLRNVIGWVRERRIHVTETSKGRSTRLRYKVGNPRAMEIGKS